MNSRRKFILNSSILASSALLGNKIDFEKKVRNTDEKEPALKDEKSLKLGIAGYSFLHFDLQQSLLMMRRMNVHYLCIKDFHLPLDSSDQQIRSFHGELKKSDVIGHAVGPIYMKNREEIDRGFNYAKKVGVNLIIGIPQINDLKYVSEKCREYNMHYAIHNHGPQDKLYPNATVVYNYVKDLDPRLGLCLDMGHDKRDGADPIKDVIKYKDRIFDLHLKDVTSATAEGKSCELGRGVIDIPSFVKALDKIGYKGICNLEHEKDMKDPLPGIAESVGYFRGVATTQRLKVT